MGLILKPEEVRTVCSTLREAASQICNQYMDILDAVKEFSMSSELESSAWNILKRKVLIYHQLIAKGVLIIDELIEADATTLENSVGTEDLYEDEIKEEIENLRQRKQELEDEITDLENIINGFVCAAVPAITGIVQNAIFRLHLELENIDRVIEMLERKLIFLYETETETKDLFQTAVDNLANIKGAINEAGNEISGTGYTNGVYKLKVETLIQENQDKLKAALEEQIKKELGNDTKKLSDKELKETMTLPEAGSIISVSLGIDKTSINATVASTNAWSIEYSIEGCRKKYPNEDCTKRLNSALEKFPYNENQEDLLKLEVFGIGTCYAGAMVEGFGEIGDVVEVTLDNDQKFNFMLLDMKSTQHESSELSPNNQCQNQWGHGYMLDNNSKVQLNVCEFITSVSSASNTSAKYYPSGTFLDGRSVTSAKVIGHVDIE